jgi:hypothetical protein
MKIIVFRFCGGARDGDTVRSDQPRDLPNEAKMLWKLTWEGKLGRRFDVSEPSTRIYQRYRVKSKYEIDDEVHVTCEHVG